MKYLSLLFLLMFNGISIHAQSLTVSPVQQHANYNQNTFPLYNSNLVIGSNSLQIDDVTIDFPQSWASSNQGKKVSVLMNRGDLYLMNMDASGNRIVENRLEFFDPSDPTLDLYAFDDGRSIIRDNVANFTFFDAAGELMFSYSNSSQSVDGERESQLSSDSQGRTVVLYNPVIAFGNNTGSIANVIYGEEESFEIFRDTQREIRQLNVSSDGAYITILAANSSGSHLYLFDRFGNELYQYQTDDELQGVSLSPEANYLTKYSSGRVQVFNVKTGESMGSTSSRNSILYAAYIPQDETVIILGGSLSGRNITDPSVTAVHLGLRQITRNEINLSLSTLDTNAIHIVKTEGGSYHLTGLNKNLSLQARF